eukprot:3842395-Prymnesium_polylepis.1
MRQVQRQSDSRDAPQRAARLCETRAISCVCDRRRSLAVIECTACGSAVRSRPVLACALTPVVCGVERWRFRLGLRSERGAARFGLLAHRRGTGTSLPYSTDVYTIVYTRILIKAPARRHLPSKS